MTTFIDSIPAEFPEDFDYVGYYEKHHGEVWQHICEKYIGHYKDGEKIMALHWPLSNVEEGLSDEQFPKIIQSHADFCRAMVTAAAEIGRGK